MTNDKLTQARQAATFAWSKASLEFLRAKREGAKNIRFLKAIAVNAKAAMKAANEAAGYGA